MRIVAEHGQFVHVDVDIARHKKIHLAVAIVVGPRRTRAEPAARDSRFFGHIFELAVAQIVVEHISAIPRHVNILEPVIVVVRNRNTHAPTLVRESRGFGDVSKLRVVDLESAL